MISCSFTRHSTISSIDVALAFYVCPLTMWEVARSLDAYESFEGSSMGESSGDSSSESESFKEKIEIPLAVGTI